MSSITITIQRTAQVQQYEPLTMTVSETFSTEGMSRDKIEKVRAKRTSELRDYIIEELERTLAKSRAQNDADVKALERQYKNDKVKKKARVIK